MHKLDGSSDYYADMHRAVFIIENEYTMNNIQKEKYYSIVEDSGFREQTLTQRESSGTILIYVILQEGRVHHENHHQTDGL